MESDLQDIPGYPKEYPKIKGFFQTETGNSVCYSLPLLNNFSHRKHKKPQSNKRQIKIKQQTNKQETAQSKLQAWYLQAIYKECKVIMLIVCLTSPTAALPGLLEQALMHDVQQCEQKHHCLVGESDSKEIERDTVMILVFCPDTHSSWTASHPILQRWDSNPSILPLTAWWRD